MAMVIGKTKDFIAQELLPHLYAQGNTNDLMTESEGEAQRRSEMVRIYEASREALRIIGDINTSTVSTSLPPPVHNSYADKPPLPPGRRNLPPSPNPAVPRRPAPVRPTSAPYAPPVVPSRP